MVYGVSVDFDCISNSDDSCKLIDSNESFDSSDTYRTQVYLGSDLCVPVFVTNSVTALWRKPLRKLELRILPKMITLAPIFSIQNYFR